MRETQEGEASQVELFLNSVPLLASLSREEKLALVDAVDKQVFAPGVRVINQARACARVCHRVTQLVFVELVDAVDKQVFAPGVRVVNQARPRQGLLKGYTSATCRAAAVSRGRSGGAPYAQPAGRLATTGAFDKEGSVAGVHAIGYTPLPFRASRASRATASTSYWRDLRGA